MKSTVTNLQLQGVALRVARRGQGRPLVLLHGGGGPLIETAFADLLSETMEVFEPVHPGFDGSKIPAHFDGVEDLAYLYLDMLDALDLSDAVLVGTSLGGWMAAELAVRNSQRIGKLVLINAIGIKPGGRDERDIPDIFAIAPAEVERLMWHDPSFRPSNRNLTDAQWEALAANRQALSMYVWEPYMHNPKLPHRLHRIKAPTLFLWGQEDKLLVPDYGRAYQKLIAGSRFQLIENAGHCPQIERPDVTARHVIEFI